MLCDITPSPLTGKVCLFTNKSQVLKFSLVCGFAQQQQQQSPLLEKEKV